MYNFIDICVSIYQRAWNLVQQQCSLIPLVGDKFPERAKSPAIPSWKAYQHRLPTQRELDVWFNKQHHTAMGIVLGRVSGLVVLDIDDAESASRFCDVFPELTQTFTVRSGNRQLPHYYFAIPSEMTVTPMNGRGCELRSDGQYVVAPGTVVGKASWDIAHDHPLKVLSQDDVRRLRAFMGDRHLAVGSKADTRVSGAKNTHVTEPTTSDGQQVHQPNDRQLISLYRRLVYQSGRNNALFNASCYARDYGWTQAQVINVLVDVHVTHPPIGMHKPETPRQRMSEALRTIASVFKRPPRVTQPTQNKAHTKQLPNVLREYLLQNDMANVARVLDGLLMVGITAGDKFTAAIAYAVLKQFGIGRNTIFVALKTLLPQDQPIFTQAAGTAGAETSSPLDPPSLVAYAAAHSADDTNQCLIGRVAKPGKKRGRPMRVFVMPDIEKLCEILKLDASHGGDTLQPEDLASPSSYRAAMHVALIQRSPGCYARSWQAQRLGISKDSCRRYERVAGVEVRPVFREWPLTWKAIDRTLSPDPVPGSFIEDQYGKRYPPLPAIARKLLTTNKQLTFKAQQTNFYGVPPPVQWTRLEDNSPEISAQSDATKGTAWVNPHEDERTVLPVNLKSLQADECAVMVKGTIIVRERSDVEQLVLSSQRVETESAKSTPSKTSNRHTPEKIHATPSTVEYLYESLRAISTDHAMTKKNADKLVQQYGDALIKRGIAVVKNRRNIRNPSGFLKVWLRSEHGKTNTSSMNTRM